MTHSPRKVLRIITRLIVGGPTWNVVHLSQGLEADYPTLLVTGEPELHEADVVGTVRDKGIQVHVIPGLSREIRLFSDVRVAFALYRLMRRERPFIVHTHTAKAGTLGRVAAFAARVPVRIHTFHGHNFRGYFNPRKTAVLLAVERVLARFSTCIVAISRNQAEELVNTYRICTRDKIRVIPLGLDLERFGVNHQLLRNELRRELNATDETIVASVGRLVPIKNLRLLLAAAAKVLKHDPRFLFVIVGHGEEKEDLARYAKSLGISARVRFLGWRLDIERIYAGVDVVALTSRNEGTPVCLIEGLAAGCAVVATNVGGVAEVLENGRIGTLIPSDDSDALADALIAQRTRDRGESKTAVTSVKSRYDVRRLLAEIQALYDALLEGRVS